MSALGLAFARGGRGRLACAAALGAALCGLLPAAAHAHGVITIRGSTLYYFSIDEVSANTVTIDRRGASYHVSDRTVVGGMDPGPCVPFSETEADCPASQIRLIHVETGSESDSVSLIDVTIPSQIRAGPGDDLVNGGGGDDSIDGGTGNDVLRGAGGNDTIAGGPGDDRLAGDVGRDALDGGAGVDGYDDGPGDDVITSRDGAGETVSCGDGWDTVNADFEDAVAQVVCEVVVRLNPSGAQDTGDITAPKLELGGRPGQPVARRRWVRATAVSNEPCVVTFDAQLRIAGVRHTYRLRRVARQIAGAGETVGADLVFGPQALASVRRAHARGRKATVRVFASALDNAGNRSPVRVRVIRVRP